MKPLSPGTVILVTHHIHGILHHPPHNTNPIQLLTQLLQSETTPSPFHLFHPTNLNTSTATQPHYYHTDTNNHSI